MTYNYDRRTVVKGGGIAAIMAALAGFDPVAAASDPAPEGKRAFSSNQTITELVPDRLYRVGCLVKAERLSWLPKDIVGGYEPINGYVLVDGENVLFFEMGMPIARPAIKMAVEKFATPERKIYVGFSRNEADCIGNMGYVLGTCQKPTMLYGTAGGILEWINDPHVSELEVRDFLGRVPMQSSKNGETSKIGSFEIDWMDGGSKMMFMTQWGFEKSTGCLFTSESFGWRHLRSQNASTIVESAKGLPSVEVVARELTERMNWMRESHYPEIIERFEGIFKKYDVQMLAPVHGCVIKGREAVAAHVKLAVAAMRAASKFPDTERLRYV